MSNALHTLYRRVLPRGLRHFLFAARTFWRESSGVARLAPRGVKRGYLRAVRVLMCFKHIAPFAGLRERQIPIWIEPAGRIFVSDWSELLVVIEIYGEPGEYEFKDLPAQPLVIVDLGANIGLSAKFFHTRFADANIIALEPDPGSFELAQRNLDGLERVSLRNLAVAPTPGTLHLHRVAGESWGTSMFATTHTSAQTFEVQAVTLDSIIQECGNIDILKLDIEGAEYEVLKGCELLNHIDCIAGEFHPISGVSPDQFFALLEEFDLPVNNAKHGLGTFLARRREQAEG